MSSAFATQNTCTFFLLFFFLLFFKWNKGHTTLSTSRDVNGRWSVAGWWWGPLARKMGSSSRSACAVAAHCRTELLACIPAAPRACFPFLSSSPLVAIEEEPASHASCLVSYATHPPLPGVSPFEGQPNSSQRLNQNLGWPWCQRQSFQIQGFPDSTALLLLFAVSLAAHTHVTYTQPLSYFWIHPAPSSHTAVFLFPSVYHTQAWNLVTQKVSKYSSCFFHVPGTI